MEETELEKNYGDGPVRVILQFPGSPGEDLEPVPERGGAAEDSSGSGPKYGAFRPPLDPGEEAGILGEAGAVLCAELYRQMEKTAEGVVCSEKGEDAAAGKFQPAAGGGR